MEEIHELTIYDPARKNLLFLQPAPQPTAQLRHYLLGGDCQDAQFN